MKPTALALLLLLGGCCGPRYQAPPPWWFSRGDPAAWRVDAVRAEDGHVVVFVSPAQGAPGYAGTGGWPLWRFDLPEPPR